MHGSGVFFYNNGDVFVGSFADDAKHGVGTYFDRVNQVKIRGDYFKGKRTHFVKSKVSEAELQEQLNKPWLLRHSASANAKKVNNDLVLEVDGCTESESGATDQM